VTDLETLICDLDKSKQVVGVEPFDVPRELLDPLQVFIYFHSNLPDQNNSIAGRETFS
jgi:hypothetical protein